MNEDDLSPEVMDELIAATYPPSNRFLIFHDATWSFLETWHPSPRRALGIPSIQRAQRMFFHEAQMNAAAYIELEPNVSLLIFEESFGSILLAHRRLQEKKPTFQEILSLLRASPRISWKLAERALHPAATIAVHGSNPHDSLFLQTHPDAPWKSLRERAPAPNPDRPPRLIVGVQHDHPQVVRHVLARGHLPLVSANALWRPKTESWTVPSALVGRCVLDSGGFSALRCYRRYRFLPTHYFDLVRRLQPLWYAAIDFCCEPELGFNVTACVDTTVTEYFGMLQDPSRHGCPPPVPVLQGHTPQDYARCFYRMTYLFAERGLFWPRFVAIGSVCRRSRPQVLATLRAIQSLPFPPDTHFHLFGVKGTVLSELIGSRVSSVDSSAYSYAARVAARKAGTANPQAHRIQHLDTWIAKQCRAPDAIQLHLDLDHIIT